MGTISSINGDFCFVTEDSAIEYMHSAASEKCDVWISGEKPYPCMAICINGEYAAITYFQNDTGIMWLSYNRNSEKIVTFTTGGEEWTPDANAVIDIGDLYECIREFIRTNEKPDCIEWQEL